MSTQGSALQGQQEGVEFLQGAAKGETLTDSDVSHFELQPAPSNIYCSFKNKLTSFNSKCSP